MGFFKRATNIATGVLIRDMVREYIKDSARKDAQKESEKRLKKAQKQREKELEEKKVDNAKARMEERARINSEFKTRGGEMIRERYNESLKQTRRAGGTVERCEIKEGKGEIGFGEFPENRLKVLDDGMLSIYDYGLLEFEGKIKKFILKKSEYERYVMYDNGILFYKTKGKNVFMKIHYIGNDKENIECILRGIPYMYEDEDTDYIYQIIDFIEKKNFEFDSQEVADLLGVDDEEAKRLIEKLGKSAGLHYYRGDEERKSESEKIDEKIIADAEKKEKRKNFWRKLLFILGAIFVLLFGLMIIGLSN